MYAVYWKHRRSKFRLLLLLPRNAIVCVVYLATYCTLLQRLVTRGPCYNYAVIKIDTICIAMTIGITTVVIPLVKVGHEALIVSSYKRDLPPTAPTDEAARQTEELIPLSSHHLDRWRASRTWLFSGATQVVFVLSPVLGAVMYPEGDQALPDGASG